MCEQGLELISTNTLLLKLEEQSSEVVVTDEIEGNNYFTFKVVKVGADVRPQTRYNAIDQFHADFTIEILPNSIIRFPKPAEIGTYRRDQILYLSIVVQPVASEDELYSVIVSFYTNKIDHGNN